VLSWRSSNTVHGAFCLDALPQTLEYGRQEILNTDQEVQFTGLGFTTSLEIAGIRIATDGRGWAFDNIFVESPCRMVKYEDIYIGDPVSLPGLTSGLAACFRFHNYECQRHSLDYAVPAALSYVCSFGALTTGAPHSSTC